MHIRFCRRLCICLQKLHAVHIHIWLILIGFRWLPLLIKLRSIVHQHEPSIDAAKSIKILICFALLLRPRSLCVFAKIGRQECANAFQLSFFQIASVRQCLSYALFVCAFQSLFGLIQLEPFCIRAVAILLYVFQIVFDFLRQLDPFLCFFHHACLFAFS